MLYNATTKDNVSKLQPALLFLEFYFVCVCVGGCVCVSVFYLFIVYLFVFAFVLVHLFLLKRSFQVKQSKPTKLKQK